MVCLVGHSTHEEEGVAKQTQDQEIVADSATTAAPRESRAWLWSPVLGVVILAAIGLVPLTNDQSALSLWTFIVMYCVLAQSWNLIGGFAGRAAFGNVAFFGIGAYTVALLLVRNQSYWLGLGPPPLIAGLLAVQLAHPGRPPRWPQFGS